MTYAHPFCNYVVYEYISTFANCVYINNEQYIFYIGYTTVTLSRRVTCHLPEQSACRDYITKPKNYRNVRQLLTWRVWEVWKQAASRLKSELKRQWCDSADECGDYYGPKIWIKKIGSKIGSIKKIIHTMRETELKFKRHIMKKVVVQNLTFT